jgi:hypothetical protein
MTKPTDDQPTTADALRVEAVNLLNRLQERASEYELPLPYGFDDARSRLDREVYGVVVVGEAKRGKSTLINALLGDDLLPTDVDVATCQVFLVRHAAEEAFRLRMEDGTARQIGRADLAR